MGSIIEVGSYKTTNSNHKMLSEETRTLLSAGTLWHSCTKRVEMYNHNISQKKMIICLVTKQSLMSQAGWWRTASPNWYKQDSDLAELLINQGGGFRSSRIRCQNINIRAQICSNEVSFNCRRPRNKYPQEDGHGRNVWEKILWWLQPEII